MWNELILMMHPSVGVIAILAAVWVVAETLNTSSNNVSRIRIASFIVAGAIWLTCVLGGYWYLLYYPADRALIIAGPWPFAHSFFMETKEHVFFPLLLLASYLPIVASDDLLASKGARTLVLWSAVLIVLLGLAMEGAGAFISMGVKMGLLSN